MRLIVALMKRLHGIALILLIAAAAAAPSCSKSPGPQRATSQAMIVSLAPSVTEILFELGTGDRVVGATKYCDYPQAALAIPRVGELGRPNLEKVLAIRPQMVITTPMERPEYAEQFRQAGIEMVVVRTETMKELLAAIEQIGQAVGRAEGAKAIVARMQGEFDAAASRFKDVPAAKRPRVYFEISANPIYTVGGASFINDVISLAGGVNVAGDMPQPYPKVSGETIIDWNPDVIVLGYMTPGSKESLGQRIGWGGVAAVKNGRIIDDINPDLLLRSGPRLAQGVRELSKRLYPG